MPRARITKRSVDGARPSPKNALLWDDEVAGFGLKVTPQGRKTYVFQFRLAPPGRLAREVPPRRYTIGQHGELTPDQARIRAKELRSLVEKGIDPIDDRQARIAASNEARLMAAEQERIAKASAFDLVADRWLESLLADEKSTGYYKTARWVVTKHLKPKLGAQPVTQIFAKDDHHAEEVVHIAREVFGKGNEFAKKITYAADDPEKLIAEFRNSYNPRIAVTVDMIATGTDIKAVEALIFLRDVRSSLYFEQMKGRGVRTINDADLKMITPDAKTKDRFILIDAVGVTESIKQVAKPLERKRDIGFEKLLEHVASGRADADLVSTLAGRIASLAKKLAPEDHAEIEAASGGQTLHDIASRLLDSIDNDKVEAETPPPVTDEAMEQTGQRMREEALRVLADGPKLRRLLVDLKKQSELYIDEFTRDAVIATGFDEKAAREAVAKFSDFLDQHQDELTALTILYGKPARVARLTYGSMEELRHALAKPPWLLEPVSIWAAYKRLSEGKITADPARVLTDIVALVRYALGQRDTLAPLSADMAGRFNLWLGREKAAGRDYGPEQLCWLEAIRDHLAANIDLSLRDLQEQPGFAERGGVIAARRAFGDRLNTIMEELPEALVA